LVKGIYFVDVFQNNTKMCEKVVVE